MQGRNTITQGKSLVVMQVGSRKRSYNSVYNWPFKQIFIVHSMKTIA